MNTTIAVAIITALATISAGSIAGVLNLLIQRQQARTQKEIRRYQIVRDSYVNFLAKFDAVMTVLHSAWAGLPPASETVDVLDHLYTPQDHFTALNIAANVIYLEGPDNVSEATRKIMGFLDAKLAEVRIFAKENVGKTIELYTIPELDIYGNLISKRDELIGKFIAETSATLRTI